MNDLISRQEAIDALCDEYCGGWQDCKYYPKCENLKAIQNLPPAQPETTRRIVGKSKGGTTLWYECERCGEPVDEGDKFCRGCGAKMEVTT